MWEEQNYSEAFAKKQIVPKDSILTYLKSNQSDVVESSDTDRNWVKNFCSAKKSRWFVEIDDDFLIDNRNYQNLDFVLMNHYHKNEIDDLKFEFNKLRVQINKPKNEFSEAKDEDNKHKDEFGDLEKEFYEIKKESKSENKFDKFKKEFDNLESKFDELENKFQEYYEMAKYLIRTKNDSVLTESDEKLDSKIYSLSEDEEIKLETIAETLYGLLHARYILTNPGLIKMATKYQRCIFGRCLRIGCRSNPVLPIGLSDKPFCFPVKIFCPLCHDIYNLPDDFEFLENTDGAFFGKSFPSIFMLNFPQFCDDSSYIYPKGLRIYKPKVKNQQSEAPEYEIPDETLNPQKDETKDFSKDDNYVEITFNRRSVLLTKSVNQS